MEPRAHHVLIGLFTVIVTCAALLFALWLGKSSYQDVELRHYTVIFNEAVRGLSRGSAVQYSGIKVGDITDLSLDPQDPRKVRAHIRVVGNIPIKQDTQAKLAMTGITGSSVIELSGGSPDSPALTGRDPVIIATPSSLTQLLANSDNLMANITELVMNAKAILSPDNARRLANMLESLEHVANSMSSQQQNVTAALHSLTKAGKQATVALDQATELLRNTDGLVRNQGARTLDSAQRAMASLEKASASVDEILSRNTGAINGSMQGMNELGPTLRELRTTLSALEKVARRLDDDPASYLLGGEKLQEFKP